MDEEMLPADTSPDRDKEAGLSGRPDRIVPKPVQMEDGSVHHPDGKIEKDGKVIRESQ